MKKLFACMALIISMSACASVFAEDYVDYNYNSDNSITNPADGYKTVLITKKGDNVTSDSIVYVDQAESGFNSVTKFLLKENPEPGYYTALFGTDNAGENSKRYSFVIGDDVNIQAADKMEAIEETANDGTNKFTDINGNITYKKAYKLITKADRYNTYQSVKLVYNDTAQGEEKPYTVMGAFRKADIFDSNTITTGSSDVGIVLQLHGMSESNFGNSSTWDLYFSTDEAKLMEGE